MQIKNLKSIGVGLTAGVLLIAFNNCAQKISGSSSSDKFALGVTTQVSEALRSVGIVQNDSATTIANKGLIDTLNQVRFYVSNSANGPFVENGTVCKGQASYYKTTGLNANLIFKGCASASAGLSCLDITKHRSFLANEWVSGNIVTTISAAESNNYPLGEYSFYISGGSGNTNIIQKVGVATMAVCTGTAAAPAPAPVAKVCNFVILNPQAVVGGGVNIYPFTCNLQNAEKRGVIRYDAGTSSKDFDADCRCN